MSYSLNEIISVLLPVVIILGILAMCGWVIKRRFIDKRWPGSASQFITRVIYSQYETQEHIEATREMNFTEEEDKDENHGGEGSNPDAKGDNPGDKIDQ